MPKTLRDFWAKPEDREKRRKTEVGSEQVCDDETEEGKRGDPSVLLTWNVNGLIQRLKSDTDWMAFSRFVSRTLPDVFCMQEVKLGAESPKGAKSGDGQPRQRGVPKTSEDSFAKEAALLRECFSRAPFNQYDLHWSLADWRYAGQLMAVRKSIKSPQMSFDLDDGTTETGPSTGTRHEPDGRVIMATFASFRLVSLYTANNGSALHKFQNRTRFDTRVTNHVAKYAKDKKPLIVIGDMNCAALDVDLSHPKWFRGQVLGEKPPKEFVGQPGCTDGERLQFERILSAGDLTDAYRALNPCDTPPPVESNGYSWRGHAGKEIKEAGKYYAKGMRIDQLLVASRVMSQVESAYIVGQGAEKERFWGSDHCAMVMKLRAPSQQMAAEEVEVVDVETEPSLPTAV